MAKRSVRGDMMRQAIAREAARLMIEHGHENYGLAKRKAAERIGVQNERDLPANREIEAALRDYQRLFQSATQPQRLRQLSVSLPV